MSSPYPAALGGLIDQLHPGLRSYFGELPSGVTGLARGTFDRVGTPRRWLWPVLRLLEAEGIAAAGWHRNVPFTVDNRPGGRRPRDTRRDARRELALPAGPWTMVDSIAAIGLRHTLVDDIGINLRLRVVLEPDVVDGALHLRSSAVGIRLGRLRLRVPSFMAPRVLLIERFDDERDRQHVSVVLELPFVGRVYEYAGYFDYVHLTERTGP